MRVFTVMVGLLAVGLMAVAAYASNPWWRLGLYGSVMAWTCVVFCVLWMLAGAAAAGSAVLRGALALAAGAAAVLQSRVALLGRLPHLPLQHLAESAVSVGGLTAAIAAVVMSWPGLRQRRLAPQILSAMGVVCAVASLAPWLRGM